MSLFDPTQRRERRIQAYRDGELSARSRQAFERRLDSDAQARAELRNGEALGHVVREVWNEGPAAPRVDLVIQALRPEMVRIDTELSERPGLRSWLSRFRETLGPVPLALAGAAAMLALALASPGLWSAADGVGSGLSTAGIAAPAMTSPSAIYDLSQEGAAPLMIFEAPDGSTVIWILENPDHQGLGSLRLQEF
jgi:anti-sigma factor RsiW